MTPRHALRKARRRLKAAGRPELAALLGMGDQHDWFTIKANHPTADVAALLDILAEDFLPGFDPTIHDISEWFDYYQSAHPTAHPHRSARSR